MAQAKKPIARTVAVKKEYIEPLNDFEIEVEETIDEPIIEKPKIINNEPTYSTKKARLPLAANK